MNKITKEQVLEKIKKSSENPASFHNPNYLMKSTFVEQPFVEPICKMQSFTEKVAQPK
jgi:hypothetical protein